MEIESLSTTKANRLAQNVSIGIPGLGIHQEPLSFLDAKRQKKKNKKSKKGVGY